jgi:hypothetical protein
MGNKITPVSLRLNINCTWKGTWFNKEKYTKFLYNEFIIKKFASIFFKKYGIFLKNMSIFMNKNFIILLMYIKDNKNRNKFYSFFPIKKNKKKKYKLAHFYLKKKIWSKFIMSLQHWRSIENKSIKENSTNFLKYRLKYQKVVFLFNFFKKKLNKNIKTRQNIFFIFIQILKNLVDTNNIVLWVKNYQHFNGSELISQFFKSRFKFYERNRFVSLMYRLINFLKKRKEKQKFFKKKNYNNIWSSLNSKFIRPHKLKKIKGLKIIGAGRLFGKRQRIAKSIVQKKGKLKRHTFSRKVDYNSVQFKTKSGLCNMKLYIEYKTN